MKINSISYLLTHSQCQLNEELGIEWPGITRGMRFGVSTPLGVGPEKGDVNFQVKNAGYYAFLLRKTTCDQKPGPDVFNRLPLG